MSSRPEPVRISLIVRQQNVGPITLLELGDRLTSDKIPELRDTFEKLELEGHRSLLLDFSHINFIDSLGIGALVMNWVSLNKRGGSLKLLNPSPRLRETLQVVGLNNLIESFDDIALALRAF